jgi:hypothetical protein
MFLFLYTSKLPNHVIPVIYLGQLGGTIPIQIGSDSPAVQDTVQVSGIYT